MRQKINIVFDGPPSHKSGRFIEVENLDGASISVGTWFESANGLWNLQLVVEVPDLVVDPVRPE